AVQHPPARPAATGAGLPQHRHGRAVFASIRADPGAPQPWSKISFFRDIGRSGLNEREHFSRRQPPTLGKTGRRYRHLSTACPKSSRLAQPARYDIIAMDEPHPSTWTDHELERAPCLSVPPDDTARSIG